MPASGLQHYLGRTIIIAIQIILFFTLMQFVVLSAGRVRGQSMEPSFYDRDRLLVWRLGYYLDAPERFHVVQLIDPEAADTLIVKRVIGLPGETILFQADAIFIQHTDGSWEQLQEPYLSLDATTRPTASQDLEIRIPEHHYYVLGDHRGVSKDSRVFGPVHRKLINGRVIMF